MPSLRNRAICMATAMSIIRGTDQYNVAVAAAGLSKTRATQANVCDAIAAHVNGVKVTHAVNGNDVIIAFDGKDKYRIPINPDQTLHNINNDYALFKWADGAETGNLWLRVTPYSVDAFNMTPVDEKYQIDVTGQITRNDRSAITSVSGKCDLLQGACRAVAV